MAQPGTNLLCRFVNMTNVVIKALNVVNHNGGNKQCVGPRGRRVAKAIVFKGKYGAILDFPIQGWGGGGVVQTKKTWIYFLEPHNVHTIKYRNQQSRFKSANKCPETRHFIPLKRTLLISERSAIMREKPKHLLILLS